MRCLLTRKVVWRQFRAHLEPQTSVLSKTLTAVLWALNVQRRTDTELPLLDSVAATAEFFESLDVCLCLNLTSSLLMCLGFSFTAVNLRIQLLFRLGHFMSKRLSN